MSSIPHIIPFRVIAVVWAEMTAVKTLERNSEKRVKALVITIKTNLTFNIYFYVRQLCCAILIFQRGVAVWVVKPSFYRFQLTWCSFYEIKGADDDPRFAYLDLKFTESRSQSFYGRSYALWAPNERIWNFTQSCVCMS